MSSFRSVFLPKDGDEIVRTFSRADIFYNRDVEKLAMHFDEKNNGRRASTQAMSLYRKSVSGMPSKDNNFGRRLSILSSTLQDPTVTEGKSSVASPAKAVGLKVLPGQTLLKIPKLYFFLLHGFLHFTAYNLPFQFMPSQMLSVGLSQREASRVFSIFAFAGLIGRLLCGFVMDHPKIGVIRAYMASQLTVGLAMLCFQFCTAKACIIDPKVIRYCTLFYMPEISSIQNRTFGHSKKSF